MTALNLPPFEHQLQHRAGKVAIFDSIRRKYVALTPEEWVRQHFVHYLIDQLAYPKALISVETGLRYNQLARRSDVLVHDRDGAPFMVVECKAPTVRLSSRAFEQVAVYGQSLRARYLTVTNGLDHYCCRMDYATGTYAFQAALPEFGQ